ncbi:hypothetical protein V1507DRAFT_8202 [Lipomyces tetrasporus]
MLLFIGFLVAIKVMVYFCMDYVLYRYELLGCMGLSFWLLFLTPGVGLCLMYIMDVCV